MSLEEIKAAAIALPHDEQRRLLGFTCFLNLTSEERAEERRALTKAIANKNPGRWETLERVEEKLKDLDEADELARVAEQAPV
ncbi:MAG: hypothetical protein QOE70_6585 [Chthoniobacter sp.]|jgi:phage-related protein|nr:hypothetical protein [Chthoniobacter sp.]